ELQLLQLRLSHHVGRSFLPGAFCLFIKNAEVENAGNAQAAHHQKVEAPAQRASEIHKLLILEVVCGFRDNYLEGNPDAYEGEKETDRNGKPNLSTFWHVTSQCHCDYRSNYQDRTIAGCAVEPRQS